MKSSPLSVAACCGSIRVSYCAKRGALPCRRGTPAFQARSRLKGVLLLFFLLAVDARSATLAARIEAILSRPAARHALWGIKVIDLDDGATLYQMNADRLFVPASNAKLFSTAMALVRLGPEYRFVTRLEADSPPDVAGQIAGNLILIGGGDPNLSSRVLPYDTKTEFRKNRLAPLEEMADQVAALGVRRIGGDIIGDDRYYQWDRYAEGWAQDDLAGEDGAPVTALAVNDNIVTLRIRPGLNEGDPAAVSFDPPVAYFTVDNHVRSAGLLASVQPVRLAREPGERHIRIWGEVQAGSAGKWETLAIDDPALFAAEALRELLLARSIAVEGTARSAHAPPGEEPPPARMNQGNGTDGIEAADGRFLILARASKPLIEDLQLTNKVSQNLHAEMAFRAVAKERRGVGSFEASLAELKEFLGRIGVPKEQYYFKDGSGLSRMDLVSPAAVSSLLRYMWSQPLRDQWVDTLPTAGIDGSLHARFEGTIAAGRLHAKTGTLTHVSALSGYVEVLDGRHLAFSIFVNNYREDVSALRRSIDEICIALSSDRKSSR